MKLIEKLFYKINENRILKHILGWVVVVAIFTYASGSYSEKYMLALSHHLVTLPPKVIAAYLLAYYQIPKLAFKGKYAAFIIHILISMYLLCVFERILVVHVVEIYLRDSVKEIYTDTIFEIFTQIPVLLKKYIYDTYFVAFIFVMVKLVQYQYTEQKRRQDLEKEKLESELNFLKAQIHPHFLFNTLNNLYTLTLKQSPKAPDVVVKLSEILDYILYKCNEKYVTLKSEIQLIKNYISLEEIRYGDRLKVNLNITNPHANTYISPLILLSFLENAFKHGVSGDIDNPGINILIDLQEDVLYFEVENTKNPHDFNNKASYKEGIGSKNIKRQLDLIYKDLYSLEVEEEKQSYKIILKIKLNKDQSVLAEMQKKEIYEN